MKTIFTHGEVATICKVPPRTVTKWCQNGSLKSYKLPGSQEFRIPRAHLVEFLRTHGFPLGELEEEQPDPSPPDQEGGRQTT